MKSNRKRILALAMCALMLLAVLTACGADSSSASGDGAQDQTDANVETGTENQPSAAEDGETQPAGDEAETPASVTIEHAYGTTEVPFSPERVCVLDSSGMDIMMTLGLTDYVTCVQQPKGYASYLTDYYTSDTIIKLESTSGGGGKGRGEVEEGADPYEVYYTIDADLIIGDIDSVSEELYGILSQIAPTVVTKYSIDHPDGVYAGTLENARMIAAIWGVEDRVDEIQAQYDPIYAALGEAVQGKTGVIMTSTADSNVLNVSANDGWESDAEKLEHERSVRVLFDLGMELYSNDIPEEVAEASVYSRGEEPEVRAEKNKVLSAWVEQVNPEYLILVDRYYTSLEDAAADGFTFDDLTGLTVVQNGGLCMLSYDGRVGSNGLHGLLMELDELQAFFLG